MANRDLRYCFMETPVGFLRVSEDDKGITGVVFTEEKQADVVEGQLYLRKAVEELNEYFAGSRRKFDVPVSMTGTDFQLRVWNTLRQIPYGETRSYQEIAQSIGNPKAMRAVGMANNRNDILILVPCHRVIGKDGSLVGFGGGLDKKKFLLDLEKENLL